MLAHPTRRDSRDHRHRLENDRHQERAAVRVTDSSDSWEPAGVELLLGPALRYVSETEATVWVETTAPCTVQVLDAAAHTFEVAGHHYALVILQGLEPGATIPYQVHLDDRPVWPPPDSSLPPSVIRTMGGSGTFRLLFGSCRSGALRAPPGPRRCRPARQPLSCSTRFRPSCLERYIAASARRTASSGRSSVADI